VWKCAFAALVLAVGCGPKTDRLPLSGTITLDGAPLDKGKIEFASISGAPLQSTGAVIRDGSYEIPAEKGLLPGTFHVEISSPDAEAKPVKVSAYPGGPTISVAPDRIPPEFNIDSEKRIDVTREGDNVFNFDVTSAKK
jgi:hypothetical protein